MNPNLHAFSDLIRWINAQGWSPATSTNYSARGESSSHPIWVSKSGVDKSLFRHLDFIRMNLAGEHAEGYENTKASAETGLHLSILESTDANIVLHTHSKADTLISRLKGAEGWVLLQNYELLKGLAGITTHESRVTVPCFANTQDISSLAQQVAALLSQKETLHGFLIESHGFYTWGRDLAEAKRHLEVFQFLFDCELSLLLSHKN